MKRHPHSHEPKNQSRAEAVDERTRTEWRCLFAAKAAGIRQWRLDQLAALEQGSHTPFGVLAMDPFLDALERTRRRQGIERETQAMYEMILRQYPDEGIRN